MAARRDPAVAYRTPFTISGVPSSLYSGRSPKLSVLMRQAISRLLKLDALIWSRGRYRVPARSAAYEGHSVSFGWYCANAAGIRLNISKHANGRLPLLIFPGSISAL